MPVQQVLGDHQAQQLGIAQDGLSAELARPAVSQLR